MYNPDQWQILSLGVFIYTHFLSFKFYYTAFIQSNIRQKWQSLCRKQATHQFSHHICRLFYKIGKTRYQFNAVGVQQFFQWTVSLHDQIAQ
nr:hypothetical protein [Paraflavitalea speifideiaquila]